MTFFSKSDVARLISCSQVTLIRDTVKNNKILVLVSVVLGVSMLAPIHFLVYQYPISRVYLWQLIDGKATIGFDFTHDKTIIVSQISYGFTDFPFSYFLLVIISGAVFLVCLVLLVFAVYRMKKTGRR